MIDFKLLRKEIKQNSTQENTAEILTYIGYEVDSNFKFRLREYEKTASTSISNTGKITDFGNGWSGDVVSIVHEFKNIPLGEATVYVAKLLDIDIRRFES